jgi:hypothetical protein
MLIQLYDKGVKKLFAIKKNIPLGTQLRTVSTKSPATESSV